MNTKAIIAIAVAVILVAGGAVAAIALMNGGDDKDDLPSKYDQRDKGIVTPVKYQNPWGTCWSFGSTGAAETSILTLLGTTVSGYKQTYGEELDLSERHLAWFALHPVTDAETDTQIGEGYRLSNSTRDDDVFDNGGRAVMAASLYSTGVGPVKESGKDYFGYWGAGKVTAYQWFNGADESAGLANTLAYLNNIVQPYDWDDFAEFVEKSTSLDDFINVRRAAGYVFPDGFDAETAQASPEAVTQAVEIFKNSTRNYMLNKLKDSNYYTEMTDWTIPATDEYGYSNRNLTAGYTMLNGNMLPSPFNVKDSKWAGVDDKIVDIMKKELQAGHGLAMSYYSDDDDGSFNEATWSQFSNNEERLATSNHAIQVVGWDDGYSKSNFKHTPERDGAWLCKNSWGSETDYTLDSDGRPIGKAAWGITNAEGKHTGYFWISYCDRTLRNILSYEFTKDIDKGTGSFNTYVYDFLPTEREGTLKSGDVLKSANVFIVTGEKETLRSVSVKTSMYGSETNVSVYKLKDGYANPVDGELLFDVTKDLGCEGFHMIIVDKDVQLSKDDKISVVVTEKSKDSDGKDLYVADYNFGYDKEHSGDSKKAIYATTVVNVGESFYLKDGTWYDWHETYVNEDNVSKGIQVDNFRIKMFTLDAAA